MRKHQQDLHRQQLLPSGTGITNAEGLEGTESLRKIVIRVTKPTKRDGECKVIVGWNEVFRIPIIYAYCSYKTYKKLHKGILSAEDPPGEAVGYCSMGRGVDSAGKLAGHNAILVWANNREEFERTIPTFMHEITHASHNIMELAGIKDDTNEVQAYIVERETQRLLGEMFGMPVPKRSDEKILEILGKLDIPDLKILGEAREEQ